MNYVNEQITKTFEHLLNLRSKYHSISALISSPKKSRVLYRINQEKLHKYLSEHDSEHLISNDIHIEENKETNETPTTKILSDKVINRKTVTTQTIFSKETNSSTDLSDQSVNTLSVILRETSELHISNSLTSVSSSLSNTNNTTTKNSISSCSELDLQNELDSEISMKTDSNQIQTYKSDADSSKPQSTNCRIYIRSIGRHMFSGDTSDEE